jgi:hypothetical protein
VLLTPTNWRLNWVTRLTGSLREVGPYAAIELLLPGGSLIALGLWAYRHRSSLAASARSAFARLLEPPATADAHVSLITDGDADIHPHTHSAHASAE